MKELKLNSSFKKPIQTKATTHPTAEMQINLLYAMQYTCLIID